MARPANDTLEGIDGPPELGRGVVGFWNEAACNVSRQHPVENAAVGPIRQVNTANPFVDTRRTFILYCMSPTQSLYGTLLTVVVVKACNNYGSTAAIQRHL